MICLLETKLKQQKELEINAKWRNRLPATDSTPSATGRIWLLWRHQVPLQVIEMDTQLIHCSLKHAEHGQIFLTFIYGSNQREERLQLWAKLNSIHQGITACWGLMGDFNAVLQQSEIHPNGAARCMDTSMIDLADCVRGLKLTDHPAIGRFFTWLNRRNQGFQCKKLGRVMVNETWLENPPFSTLEFL